MRLKLLSAVGCVWALLLGLPARALAQNPVEDGASTAKIRLGPFGLTPQFTLRDFGVDTNATRSADARRDLTATFEPAVDSFFHAGHARVAAKSAVQIVYFGRTVSQRSLGRTQSVTGSYEFARITPYAGVTYSRTQRSTDIEIDQRAPQTMVTERAGFVTAFGPLFNLDVVGQKSAFRFDPLDSDAVIFADSLNRHSSSADISLRYVATPLTTVVLRTIVEDDRFDVSPLRNSNSLTVTPGVEFKPYALMSGSAYVGYRRFNALDASVPDFTGLTASVGLTFIAREMTKIAVDVRRDVDFSYEQTQPYFITTTAGLTLTQMLGPTWDVVGRLSRTGMAYRSVTTVTDPLGRNDHVNNWGLGLGRHLASGIRLGFDVDYMRRSSVVDGRGFHGLRLGGSVTYGS